VKSLAGQTADATKEIGTRIAQIQTATKEAVDAIQGITATIEEVSAIATTIGSAIEEQGAATAEIARNVTQTATATNEMECRIGEVSAEARQTDQQAADVRANTAALAEAVAELRRAVVRVVRTSTPEVDRRATTRFTADLPCRVSGAGVADQAARLVDLSEGGASIDGGPRMAPGASGSLFLDAVGVSLPFTVRHADGGSLRVAFALNVAEQLCPVLDRLGRQRAA
jgi:methyl-accepting chemotaxis protein